VSFPCPRCGKPRADPADACDTCGWAPRTTPDTRPPPRLPATDFERRQLARIATAVVLALVLGGVKVVSWFNLGSMGDACDGNEGCHSKLCLPGVDKEELDRARAAAAKEEADFIIALADAADDDERESLRSRHEHRERPLSPRFPGVCTESCDDDGCPAGWTCGSVTLTGPGFDFGARKKVCFAPDDPLLAGTGE
jgi:hypothetical protein